ncbi:MAG: RelE toxin of RelE / RelB toxin-antitoxin system [Burkholderiales bacterium]|nr:RelE toxin of RelE / RelB toxin-antitoxin system [Burkholderiales bacterium]
MWFYIFGFSKNEKDNITEREKIVLTEVAAHLLSLSAAEREKLVLENKLYEVNYESK